MYTKKELLEKIDKNLELIKNSRPLSKTEINELRKSLGVMFTYASNSIEWSTITLWETKLILEDWLTIWWKTLREINEVSNHKWLLNFLYEFIELDKDLDEDTIKKVHNLVLRNIDDENAWNYRKIQCYISWESEVPPEAKEIPKLIKELILWYKKNKNSMHKSLFVSEFHYKFVKIHPFIDWNGRTIRILLNIILMKYWYPMVIVSPVRRWEYISSLNSSSNFDKFNIFMLDTINTSLEDYIRMIDY